jgi:hypothetical protein
MPSDKPHWDSMGEIVNGWYIYPQATDCMATDHGVSRQDMSHIHHYKDKRKTFEN